jgi:hypothetical protein
VKLFDHPAVQHASKAVDALLSRRDLRLTGDQARQVIVVEMTYEGESSLRDCYDFGRVHIHPPTRTPAETMRAKDFLHGREGPMTIMGVRYYRVDRLPDGDQWRVLNALGTR